MSNIYPWRFCHRHQFLQNSITPSYLETPLKDLLSLHSCELWRVQKLKYLRNYGLSGSPPISISALKFIRSVCSEGFPKTPVDFSTSWMALLGCISVSEFTASSNAVSVPVEVTTEGDRVLPWSLVTASCHSFWNSSSLEKVVFKPTRLTGASSFVTFNSTSTTSVDQTQIESISAKLSPFWANYRHVWLFLFITFT